MALKAEKKAARAAERVADPRARNPTANGRPQFPGVLRTPWPRLTWSPAGCAPGAREWPASYPRNAETGRRWLLATWPPWLRHHQRWLGTLRDFGCTRCRVSACTPEEKQRLQRMSDEIDRQQAGFPRPRPKPLAPMSESFAGAKSGLGVRAFAKAELSGAERALLKKVLAAAHPVAKAPIASMSLALVLGLGWAWPQSEIFLLFEMAHLTSLRNL